MNPRSSRARVVLPLPLSPATVMKDGASLLMDREKLSSATVAPDPWPKIFVTCFTSRRAVMEAPNQYRWHATQWSGLTSRNEGISPAHRPNALGHRGWKTQPGG